MTHFFRLLSLLLDYDRRGNHLLNNAHLLHKTHRKVFIYLQCYESKNEAKQKEV